MAVQMLGIKTKFTDDQGRPLIGGSVHTYYAGTNLPQDTFSDPELTVPNTNPVILDDTGSADIFLKGAYRIRVFDKSGRFIEEQDNVTQAANESDVSGLLAIVNTNEETRALGLNGFDLINSFELGATIAERNQALRHAADGKLYRWAGDLPKVVPASSTPASSGGIANNAWLEVSDTVLRQELSNPIIGGGGAFLVNGSTIQFPTLLAAKSAKGFAVGDVVLVNGRDIVGDGGHSFWSVVLTESVTPNGFDTVSIDNDADKSLQLMHNQVVTPIMVGAKPDGSDSTNQLLALFKSYKKIEIPEGVFSTTKSLMPAKDSTIEFKGWIKILDNTPAPPYEVMRARYPGITLINPLLDGNRDNTPDMGGQGMYAVLAIYGEGENLKVVGGQIINGRHNLLQGGRDGLHITGTYFANAGEHPFYVNSIDTRKPSGKSVGTMIVENCEIRNAGIEAKHAEGHYFQIRSAGTFIIRNCKTGGGTYDPTMQSGAIQCTNVDKLIVDGCEFKDITGRAIWFGPDANLGGGGDIECTNTSFVKHADAPRLVFARIKLEPDKTVKFTNCSVDGFYVLNNEGGTNQIHKSIYTNTHFYNVSAEFSLTGDVLMRDCVIERIGTGGNGVRVFDGTTKLNNLTITGQATSMVLASGSAKLFCDGLKLPDMTSGNGFYIDTTEHCNISNSFMPAFTSGIFLRTTANNTTPLIVTGNYAPKGILNVSSGVEPIMSANKFYDT